MISRLEDGSLLEQAPRRSGLDRLAGLAPCHVVAQISRSGETQRRPSSRHQFVRFLIGASPAPCDGLRSGAVGSARQRSGEVGFASSAMAISGAAGACRQASADRLKPRLGGQEMTRPSMSSARAARKFATAEIGVGCAARRRVGAGVRPGSCRRRLPEDHGDAALPRGSKCPSSGSSLDGLRRQAHCGGRRCAACSPGSGPEAAQAPTAWTRAPAPTKCRRCSACQADRADVAGA